MKKYMFVGFLALMAVLAAVNMGKAGTGDRYTVLKSSAPATTGVNRVVLARKGVLVRINVIDASVGSVFSVYDSSTTNNLDVVGHLIVEIQGDTSIAFEQGIGFDRGIMYSSTGTPKFQLIYLEGR